MNVYTHPFLLGHSIDCNRYITIKHYKKGDIIHSEGDICDHLSLVSLGNVSVSTYTYSEKEYSIASINSGGIFGQFLLFSDNPHFLGNVIATTKATIIRINKDNLLRMLSEDRVILTNFLGIVATSFISIQERVKILSQKSIKDSIMFYINEITKKTKQKTIYIKSKETLAKYLNIPRPSLSRSLIALKKEGLISINGKYITKI
ncbi:MAG: Crp/Fnr family transcriptional regulator [Bacilli bacterium]|nr:Crp/Fnr family transcriptional regulator [Bacilli bacterium]